MQYNLKSTMLQSEAVVIFFATYTQKTSDIIMIHDYYYCRRAKAYHS